MVFTISLLIDVVISLLCIAGAVALCIYGGGMGVAIVIIILSGIYCLQFGWTNQIGNLVIGRIKFGNHPNILHVMWMDVLLGACWYGISMIPSSVEYSKRKQKKIQKNLYNWKPWNYCGIKRYPANKYLFCWNDYDEFR